MLGGVIATARTPNTALADLLRAANWKHAAFARAVNELGEDAGLELTYGESAVSYWLAGVEPKGPVRALVCEALSRRLRRPVTFAAAGLKPVRNGETSGADVAAELVDLGSTDMDPIRRAVVFGAGLSTVSEAIPRWEDVRGRFDRLLQDPQSRIGQREVATVQAMTRHLLGLDDQYGGRTARPLAAAFLVNTIAPALRARATAPVRSAMLSAAAEHVYLMAFMATDEGAHRLAQSYYLKAVELAGLADDHLRYCTALRGLSVQASNLGRGPEALRWAEAAAEAVPRSGPRLKAFMLGQVAHAMAQTNQHTVARRALRKAEAALSRAGSDAPVTGNYTPTAFKYHQSQVFYEAGDLAASISAMEASNALRPAEQRRFRLRDLGTLAERKLKAGRIEEACTDWGRMLDEYPLVNSGWCDESYRTMVQALAPHRRRREPRELLERARTVRITNPT